MSCNTTQQLRAAATLSLAKFMLVSETFCENNLQLLFTVLDKSSDPTVRANTIIAAGTCSTYLGSPKYHHVTRV